MYKFILLIVVVLGNILVIHTEKPKCGENEVLVDRPRDCRSDYCPKCADEDQTCTGPEKSTPECKCRLNYRRADNGTCIPTRECPPFDCSGKAHEEYDPCPPMCPNGSCAQARLDGRCPLGRIGIINICRPQCRCIKNYFRNDKGNCVHYYQCQPIECGPNEVLDNCTNVCSSGYCKKTADEGRDCISAPVCGKPACKCRFNYSRAENGTCIPTEQCPPFYCNPKLNEKYNSCPPFCPDGTCDQATPDGRCPLPGRIGIVVECNPRCTCFDGYYRNKAGKCVPYSQCPGKCPKNEVYSECMEKSGSQSCSPPDEGSCDIDESSCTEGCVCKDGYLRADNKTCVPKDKCNETIECGPNEQLVNCTNPCMSDKCPKRANEGKDCNSAPVCGQPACKCRFNYRRAENGTCIPTKQCRPFYCNPKLNEKYDPCPPLCPNGNCDQARPDGKCPLPGRIGIVLECNPRCSCFDGYYRNKDGKCVPYSQCPGVCPENEVYSNCTQTVCNQSCSGAGRIFHCPLVKTENCKTGCLCKKGYYRLENGTCVSQDQCPTTKSCPENEVYSNCTQVVCNQNCSAAGRSFNCPLVKEEDCKKGCLCKKDYYRQEDGTCVPQDQCKNSTPPLTCSKNEVVRCVKECPPEKTCRTQDIQVRCRDDQKPCQEKCVCKKNHYRNSIGECISKKECDKCTGDHEFYSCGSACDNECDKIATQNRTNCPIRNIKCNEQCYCDDGWARDDKGKCIPVEQCPKTEKCGPNEEYKCGQSCPPDTCMALVARFKCDSEEPCKGGCYCCSGYFRQDKGSPCIPICECNEMKNSPDCQSSDYNPKQDD
ncbi:hypothetical protein K1T71_004654 [Dendrolimus kikuchii]|uniref:Uncharacterized protein n=1 Tax=Dendrolimus kikuchii TaxID=765133 RepID=A0ACC1D817_9NEOP|nr:hypothetical protein K1T71_004654 [Dendrolimus kikuchii]